MKKSIPFFSICLAIGAILFGISEYIAEDASRFDLRSSVAFFLLSLAGALVLFGFLGLIFSKHIAAEYTIKRSFLSLGVSASVAAGIYGVLTLIGCIAFYSREKFLRLYPFDIPASGILMLISFVAFCLLAALLYRKKSTARSRIMDIVLIILTVPIFFTGGALVHEILSEFVKSFY